MGGMALGVHDPTWRALAERLGALCTRAGAENAVVADAWNDLWCRATTLAGDQQPLAFHLLDWSLSSATKPLPKGGRVDLANTETDPYFAARSFAGVYVLIVWFAAPFDVSTVRGLMRHALPDIERLTCALPPPDGPDRDANADRKPP